jgi:hypothetical protein
MSSVELVGGGRERGAGLLARAGRSLALQDTNGFRAS